MSSRFYLVRHGEVVNPERVVYADLDGFPLSDRGRLEAEATGRHLARLAVAAIYASPLLRAQQTAVVFAAATGATVYTDEGLTEWRLSRRWKGIPWDQVDRRFPGEMDAYLHHPHDLPFAPESALQLGERMAAAARRIAADHPGEEVVAVTHQDPLQAGRLVLTGRPLSELHVDKPGHAAVVTFEPADGLWEEIDHWSPEIPGPPPPEWPPTSTAGR